MDIDILSWATMTTVSMDFGCSSSRCCISGWYWVMWRSMFHLRVKVRLQMVHEWALMPLWARSWRQRTDGSANACPQIRQRHGLTPVCVRKCFFQSLFHLNCLQQWLHVYTTRSSPQRSRGWADDSDKNSSLPQLLERSSSSPDQAGSKPTKGSQAAAKGSTVRSSAASTSRS